MSEEGLKPCPICGATIVRYFYNDDNVASVGCQNCGFETRDHRTEEAAAREWNSLLRQLKWTKELPHKAGWYFIRIAKQIKPEVVEVTWYNERINKRLIVLHPDYSNQTNLKDLECEWAGPIQEPIEGE